MMHKSQFHKIDPYDWFCGPWSHTVEMLKENATVFPYSNMFFPQLRRVDMYLSRLSPCT